MKHKYMRRVSNCYLLEEDVGFETSPVKICRSRELAEHYKRILTPKWIEAFGFGLRVVETRFYEDLRAPTPVECAVEDWDIGDVDKDELICKLYDAVREANRKLDELEKSGNPYKYNSKGKRGVM